MEDLIISNYYKNPITFEIKNEENFIIKKRKANSAINILKSRTICNLHRLLLAYVEEKKFKNIKDKQNLIGILEESLWYSHFAVLKLRDYKKDFDKGWWESIKSQEITPDDWWQKEEYKSRTMTQEDYNFALKLMLNNDNIHMFNLIREIYKKMNIENVKDICLEIIWMSYRINKKHCDYESRKKI